MNQNTIEQLNAINRAFYQTTAKAFDATRGRAWAGWEQLAPYLSAPLSALDVGCGNGRFGLFLRETLQGAITYHGMDNNAALLNFAREALAAQADISATFDMRDIIQEPPATGTYDLVVLFGVMHHVPGAERRKALMQTLAERTTTEGLLVVACWRFYEYERFQKRLVDFPAGLDVEKNDFLLDWRRGERALRYCHYVDDAEQTELIAASGLQLLTTYRADGADGRMNSYIVLKNGTV